MGVAECGWEGNLAPQGDQGVVKEAVERVHLQLRHVSHRSILLSITGVYKVLYNLIVFTNPIFKNLEFLPQYFRSVPHLNFQPTHSLICRRGFELPVKWKERDCPSFAASCQGMPLPNFFSLKQWFGWKWFIRQRFMEYI